MGRLSNYKTKIVSNCLENKLSISFRDGTERTGWYYFGNKKVLRVTIPKEHGGSSSLSPKVAKRVINSLRLTNEGFDKLYECPMSGADYKGIVSNLISQKQL